MASPKSQQTQHETHCFYMRVHIIATILAPKFCHTNRARLWSAVTNLLRQLISSLWIVMLLFGQPPVGDCDKGQPTPLLFRVVVGGRAVSSRRCHNTMVNEVLRSWRNSIFINIALIAGAIVLGAIVTGHRAGQQSCCWHCRWRRLCCWSS